MSKHAYGLSFEFNSNLHKPWLLIAWDSRSTDPDIYEMFETKEELLARLAEVRRSFSIEVGGLFE